MMVDTIIAFYINTVLLIQASLQCLYNESDTKKPGKNTELYFFSRKPIYK